MVMNIYIWYNNIIPRSSHSLCIISINQWSAIPFTSLGWLFGIVGIPDNPLVWNHGIPNHQPAQPRFRNLQEIKEGTFDFLAFVCVYIIYIYGIDSPMFSKRFL